LAKREGIEIRQHEIIYDLIDEVRSAMTGLLTPDLVDRVMGHADVRKVFSLSRGTVAGCFVTDGKITSRMKVRVLRGKDVMHDGSIQSLRRFENDVSEVREGQECGVRVDNFTALAEGDRLEFYEVDKIMPSL
jgi:translation initiation factor IF-2